MKNTRRILIKLTGAAAVFGVVLAMAATLTVDSKTVGAGDATLAACDTGGIKTDYAIQWDSIVKIYEVATVTVSDIADACNGKAMKITLLDSAGAVLKEATTTVSVNSTLLTPDTSDTLTIVDGASAKAVSAVHVVIAG